MSQIVVHRDKPLADETYAKLDTKALEVISFRERIMEKTKFQIDEYGDRVPQRQYVFCGYELFTKGDVSPQLVESLQRPAPKQHIAYHMARLAAHKPYGQGPAGFGIVTEDVSRILDGKSEYAVIKACEYFIKDRSTRFFPDSGDFIELVASIDFSLKNLHKTQPGYKPEPQPAKVSYVLNRSNKQKRRVAKLVRLACVPKDKLSKWEKLFLELLKKHAKGT